MAAEHTESKQQRGVGHGRADNTLCSEQAEGTHTHPGLCFTSRHGNRHSLARVHEYCAADKQQLGSPTGLSLSTDVFMRFSAQTEKDQSTLFPIKAVQDAAIPAAT